MKILLTSDWFTPSVNGVVVSIMNLYHELKKKGHEVKILTLSKTDESYSEGDFYFVRSFDIKVYPDVRATLAFNSHLVDQLIEWNPDIIHSQCEFFTYSFANRISRKTSTPIVHTYHTLYEYYTKYLIKNENVGKKLVKQIMRFRLKDAYKIIAPTHKVKSYLLKYRDPGDIVVIPSGIDLSKYERRISVDDKNALKEKLGIEKDKKILLFLGRLGEEKNIQEVLLHYKALRKERSDTLFLIVGDGPYRKELEDHCQELNLTDSVLFTGMVPPSNIIDYYQLGDLFVSASQSETQGLTYIEALANGVPELCKADDALIDVIIPGYNGYVYETSDEFIRYALQLLGDETKRLEFSHHATLSSEKFSTAHFGDAVEALYREVLTECPVMDYKARFQRIIKKIPFKNVIKMPSKNQRLK